MAENSIAINMFAQVDKDGNRHVLFDEITDHRSDESAVKQANAFITNKVAQNDDGRPQNGGNSLSDGKTVPHHGSLLRT